MAFQLTDEQLNAVNIIRERLLISQVAVLAGYAGTGKGVTISHLAEHLGYRNIKYVAFTGTAAKEINKKNPEQQATTIHRLIYNVVVDEQTKEYEFQLKPQSDLTGVDLIVVDEYSMVNGSMMRDLQSFGIPIILVGDMFQLPAVDKNDPNPYWNYYDVQLTHVHRQALDSPVLKLATDIREGKVIRPGVYGTNEEVYIGRKSDLADSWYRAEVQFLCGTNATKDKINEKISGAEPEHKDKIIFLKNDWSTGITNGTMAQLNYKMKIGRNKYKLNGTTFDGIELKDYEGYYKKAPTFFFQSFEKAYAITVHKAQGQTIDAPIVIVDESSLFGEDADRWLYTAVTRSTGNYKLALLR